MKMNVSKLIGVGVMVVSCLLGTGAQATITTYLSENFDSTAVGAMPAGWTSGIYLGGAGQVSATNNLAVSAPNSLLVGKDAFDGGWAYAIKPFSAAINSNSTVFTSVSFDLQPKQVTGQLNTLLSDGAAASIMTFNSIGQIRAGAGTLVAPSYVADTWYHVQIGFWPLYHSFNVEVSTNGTLVGSATGVPFTASNVNLYDLYLQSYLGNFYYDNLLIYDDTSIVPEPGSVALLGCGAAVALWWRRRAAGR